MTRAPDRITWALELLGARPTDRVLEIGCGHGIAVSLLGPALRDGAVVGIDPSASAIASAERRNRQLVDRGVATFLPVALEDTDFDEAFFDRAFAVNVHFMRKHAARQAAALRRALRPGGVLLLVQHHPSEARTRKVTDELRAGLEANGVTVVDERETGHGAGTMTCLFASAA